MFERKFQVHSTFARSLHGSEFPRERISEDSVEMTRFYVPHTDRMWAVDVFEGDNEGLVVADLRLVREDERFELPDWVRGEVTDFPRYQKSNLAKHPYSKWGELQPGEIYMESGPEPVGRIPVRSDLLVTPPKKLEAGWVCHEFHDDGSPDYDAAVLASTETADKYRTEHGFPVGKPESWGSLNIEVLPNLTGRPWDQYALNMVYGLRPSSLRVTTGTVTCDCSPWRVTVFLEKDERTIRSITQEAYVGLTGAKHGHGLSKYAKGADPEPCNVFFNARGLERLELKKMTFLGSEKSVWDEIGFKVTAAWGWTQEQRDAFKEAVKGGYLIGNLDFVLCSSLEELPTIQKSLSGMGTPDIDKMIAFRLEHGI